MKRNAAKTMSKTKPKKYDVSAIPIASVEEPRFLVRSWDGKLIIRRNKATELYTVLANNQKTAVNISFHEAKQFALWILAHELAL